MIYDTTNALENYKGISKNLDTAIDYIMKNQFDTLETGAHKIDGDNVIVHIQNYETKDGQTAEYEAHKKYIDIQMTLEGEEYCYYTPLENLVATGPFNEDNDIGFFNSEVDNGIALPLIPHMFSILFPHDAHKPCCTIKKVTPIKKVVIKVKA
jgi:YhcH/YjgK/YiaL family protein